MKSLSWLFPAKNLSRTFPTPGGITPPHFKEHSLRSQIMPAPIPEELWLSLRQQDGNALAALVCVGDSVLKNQLIAIPSTERGVPVFAPTSGTVKEIDAKLVASAFAEWQQHIVIAADGLDASLELRGVVEHQLLNPVELTKKLHELGISGFGGADFPTTIKLTLASQTETDWLIINGVECEPFISADEALIREKAEQIVAGAEILQQASGAKNCVIAIEEDAAQSIEALQSATAKKPIRLALVTTKYPAGGEKQIIQAVTGKEVPYTGRPADIGVLVQNIGTAYAAYNAITNGQPCISRVTTLSGTPLKTPKNFAVLLGTPIPFLLKLCGIDPLQHESTIVGGSMMGITLYDENVAISRASNCVIATSVEWFPELPPELACIRCGDCADVCPAKLLPQQLYAFSRSQDLENLADQHLSDCIECGACSYVCPSNIPLVQYFKASKSMVQDQIQQSELSEHWQERYQYHQYRLKKDKEEAVSRKAGLAKKRLNSSDSTDFSRSNAKAIIAAAVNRVKKRKVDSALNKKPGNKSGPRDQQS